MRTSPFVVACLCLLMITGCRKDHPVATHILYNANIWTGNSGSPRATAMAIQGDTILAVGSDEEILKLEGNGTFIEDMNGKFIVPGFIDTHVHLFDGGFSLSSVQLRDAATPEEFINRISAFAKTVPEGTWIMGGEWDGSQWGSLPTHEWIDSVTLKHPVFVTRLDGHMSLANSLAMKLAGVDNKVKDVDGGVIIRGKLKEPTGIFKDNAVALIASHIPPPSKRELDQAAAAAMKYFASNGVTTVHHVWYPSELPGQEESLRRINSVQGLKTRVYELGSLENWEARAKRVAKEGAGNRWLKINGLKGVFDGALGSHTAAFMKPFTDDPKDSGLLMFPEEDLYTWVSNADKNNLQVAVHAIGDRAINILLNTYERVTKENGARDRRFRVEHAQHIAPEDIQRFADLKVIASMQPYHAIDDGRWAEKIVGPERIKTTYAFKSLLDARATVAFGSDWPVAPAVPLLGIYAAVTRRTIDDKNPNGWIPEQKISVEQALECYTKNGAFASFEEGLKGTLETGKLADFVVMDSDLTKLDPVKIKDAKILQTYVGARKVYDINDH